MFTSQVLKSVAALSRSPAVATSAKTSSKVILRASRRGLATSWLSSETKRLGPTLLIWGGFMTVTFGWPFAVKEFSLAGL
ncbi:LAMI_0H15786g1_1 [Lachancea mirantina]|uniref:LAMI_0H15786g1_1 n=1 Tax=Lachancea mirantina TaxID=1230905 RepID=A0A1G4KJ03_9SACH|nr:LAMI_0H15786g1_1 [Lachancea mirantina]